VPDSVASLPRKGAQQPAVGATDSQRTGPYVAKKALARALLNSVPEVRRGHQVPHAHRGAFDMSNKTQKSEGKAEEIGGKLKNLAGKVIGNEQMEAEGKAKELGGKAKQQTAKAAERTKGKTEELVGKVKNRVGALIDNEQMQAEGKVKELKGEVRQRANR
jgi:uncharacterized protein YjbJ (UPF0337 family)